MSEKISCIYVIKSIVKPDRFYVGSTVSWSMRKYCHLRDLKNNKHHSIFLQRHFNKHGIDDLSFEILEEVPISELLTTEQKYIDLIQPYFNTCKIAGSTLGVKKTEAQILAHIKIMTGKKHSPEQNLGKSKRQKGRPVSDEMKKRISDTLMGHGHSEETRLRISNTLMGHTYSKTKKILDTSTGEIYGGINIAAKVLNMHRTTLRRHINGKNKTKQSNLIFYHATG